MSEDSLPLEQWPAGIQQASVPANENALRVQALLSRALSVENDAPGTEYNGAVYIVGDTPTGAFANFNEHDIALYEYDSWYAWSPVLGSSMVIANERMVFNGTEWVADPSVGGGGGAVAPVVVLAGTAYDMGDLTPGAWHVFTSVSPVTITVEDDSVEPVPANAEYGLEARGYGGVMLVEDNDADIIPPKGGTLALEFGDFAVLKRTAADVYKLIGSTVDAS